VRTRLLAAGSIMAIMLLGCGATGEVAAGGSAPGAGQEHQPAPDETGTPEAPEETDDPFGDFDREASREQAESYLGVAEEDVEETGMVRIVRRGEERYMVTMDLRPGRLNLELDDDGSGTYLVTRVVVEVPDDDELVVE
jgi:hypothetical protein